MCGAWREMCGFETYMLVNRKQMGAIIEKGIRGIVSFFFVLKSHKIWFISQPRTVRSHLSHQISIAISCEGEIVPLADFINVQCVTCLHQTDNRKLL